MRDVAMPYWRLYYHVVWETIGRNPWLIDERANIVEAAVRIKVHDHMGIVHAVAVMPDHVHLAMSLPPSVAPADAFGHIKGAAGFLVRLRDRELVRDGFRWQSGYGVLSFGERALPMVVAYIADQEHRHATNILSAALERQEPPFPT